MNSVLGSHHFRIIKDVVDAAALRHFFHSNKELQFTTNGMTKIDYPHQYPIVENTIKELSKVIDSTGTIHSCIGDNFFKHSDPYFPHVDICEAYPTFNCLLPLELSEPCDQRFIVFDQYVTDRNPATWMGDINMEGDFISNKKAKFVHSSQSVGNLTGHEIDESFYRDHLMQGQGRPRELFFGMSGTAIEYTPGDVILFDSKYIHCTGSMQCSWKLGLSLRFQFIGQTQ